MAMQFSRNLVIPVWFAVFALVTIFAPPFDFFPSVFLLVMGLVVPAMAYLLWQDPPLPVGAVQSIDATPKRPLTHSAS